MHTCARMFQLNKKIIKRISLGTRPLFLNNPPDHHSVVRLIALVEETRWQKITKKKTLINSAGFIEEAVTKKVIIVCTYVFTAD